MASVYEELVNAEEDLARDNFASRSGYIQLYVADVERDGLGNPLKAIGTDPNGVTGFPVIVAGRAQVEEGETILAEFNRDAPAGGALYYKAHLSSDLAGMGAARKTPGPPPSFAPGTWDTVRIVGVPNAIYARITILFTIEPRYNPSKVIISHRQVGSANWTDEIVPFLISSAIQGHELITAYPSGVNVEVQMRAEYQYAYGPSDTSEVRTVLTPTDGVSPGNASGLDVNVSVAGILRVEATGTIDRARYVGWRYEFTQSASGPATATAVVDGFYEYHVPTPGLWYVAVSPISIAGVLGGRYPSSTPTVFSGPFTVPTPAAPPDNTAPAAWSAPTVATRVATGTTGGAQGFLKVTFPARALYESDYNSTVVRLTNGTTFDEWSIEYKGSPPDPIERPVDFGIWTVWIYATDRSGNKSALSLSTNGTVSDPGIPAAGGSPTIDSPNPPLANGINWVVPARALIVELQRATDAIGTGATTIYQGQGNHWLDIHTELTTFPTTYYYRIRGRNNAGDGTFSAWVGSSIQAVSGTVVAANTLVGDRIVVGTLDGNTLKANTTITSLLKTAASGARWEIEGHTGSAGQDQIRAYNASALKFSITPSAVTFWGDGGTADIQMGTASSRGYLTTGGVTLGPYQTQFDFAYIDPIGNKRGVRFFDSGDVNSDYRWLTSLSVNGSVPTLCLVSDYSAATPVGVWIGQANGYNMASTLAGLWLNRASIIFQATSVTQQTLTLMSGNMNAGSTITGYMRFTGNLKAYDVQADRGSTTGVYYIGNQSEVGGITAWVYDATAHYWYMRGTNLGSWNSATGLVSNTRIYSAVGFRAGANGITGASFNGWNGSIGTGAGGASGALAYHVASTGSDANRADWDEYFYRFQGTDNYPGTAYFMRYMINGGSVLGGAAIFGITTAGAHYWGLGNAGATMQLFWSGTNNRIEAATNFNVQGTLTKVAGTFRIPHPDPKKADTLDLRHSFVEGPTRGENLYRYTFQAKKAADGTDIALPDWFRFLNVLEGEGEDQYRPQVWVNGEGLDQAGYGTVSADGKTLTVVTRGTGRYNILILATRKDKAARDHWDGEGGAEIAKALPEPAANPITSATTFPDAIPLWKGKGKRPIDPDVSDQIGPAVLPFVPPNKGDGRTKESGAKVPKA